MARIILVVLLFCSFGLRAQSTEADIKSAIDYLRVHTLSPSAVGNVLDAINYAKESIVGVYTASGTDTYAVTAGTGITNNDANKRITVKFTNANTSGTVTLNVNGIGALPLKTNLGANPDIGGIGAGSIYLIASTGTTWRIVGPTNEGGVLTTNFGEIGGSVVDQTNLYDTLGTKWRVLTKIKPIATNYTASLGDQQNKIVIINGGADFKIPKDADVNFPIGSNILAVDSLGTATYSKDAAVHIDTLEQAQVFTKVAANRFVVYKAGGAALTDGSGTTASGSAADLVGTLNKDATIETGAFAFNLTKSAVDNFKVDGDGKMTHHFVTGTNDQYIFSDNFGFQAENDYVSTDTTFTASLIASTGNSGATLPVVDFHITHLDNSDGNSVSSNFSATSREAQVNTTVNINGSGNQYSNTVATKTDGIYFRVQNGLGQPVTTPLKIEVDGSFSIGGSNGTSGQYLQSTGSTTAPIWVTPNRLFSGNFSQVGAATTVFTVTIGTTQANNTYETLVTPTSALGAALFYVTNKTTTTFDVTYLAGLTGTVQFDWILRP